VIVAMLVTAAFLIVAMFIRRAVVPNPLVNFAFLWKRNTLIVAAALFSFRFVLLSVALLIPGFLGAIAGYRPVETGRVITWVVLPQLVMGLISAHLMRRLDGRLVLGGGFAVVAAACLMNARITSAWADVNFVVSQLVLALGLSLTFVGVVGCIIQQAFASGALSQPMNILTFSAFIHTVRLLGGEAGTAAMQRVLAVREQYHSNIIGLSVDLGNWQTGERLTALAAGLFPESAGLDGAQERAAAVLGSQVRAQATTLAYLDAFTVCAVVAAVTMILIACMKPMKIVYDSHSPLPPGR
jgi:DHA2 family multidrug resistance protein